jgi:hypothetical protein
MVTNEHKCIMQEGTRCTRPLPRAVPGPFLSKLMSSGSAVPSPVLGTEAGLLCL